MPVLDDPSPATVLALFAAAGIVIAVAGIWLTRLADVIAYETGAGQALTGGILLGATTSLGGTVTSVTTAWTGDTDLAISNAIGGIAVQTAFLAVADLVYRRANLEHSGSSLENLLQCGLLISMLALPLTAAVLPGYAVWGVSPVSVVLVAFYVLMNRMIMAARDNPMWYPRRTRSTQREEGARRRGRRDLAGVFARFAAFAVVVAVAGWALGRTGVVLAAQTGLSQTAVGGVMTSVMTSAPELVTAIAAVRRGSANLAIGGIIGGNAFDVLFLVASDVAYRDGSIYAEMTATHHLILAASILMAAILLLGLLKRDREGPAGIGFEGVLIFAIYAVVAFFVSTG